MCHGKNNHGDGRREATKIYGQEGITAANARVVPKVGVVFVHWGCVPGLHHVAELPRVDNHDRTGAIHESQPAGLMEVPWHVSALQLQGPCRAGILFGEMRRLNFVDFVNRQYFDILRLLQRTSQTISTTIHDTFEIFTVPEAFETSLGLDIFILEYRPQPSNPIIQIAAVVT